MKYLVCDVCRKEFEEPFHRERDIFFIDQYDICEDCRDDLERSIKYTVRDKTPFDFGWFKRLVLERLEEGNKKGKIPIPSR
jgi:hypothetical protein